MLSAPAEGLIAKIDLIDLQAGVAVPVDYKRGRVPDVPGGAWEPEMVQLCAQGLILRENGYQCEGGILYYIESRRRVSVPFDDGLVDRTRELLGEMRQTAAAGVVPPPLDDSPKCPRCSLVGICLPDEVNLLTGAWPSPPAPLPEGEGSHNGDSPIFAERKSGQSPSDVRRLVPARDDALPLYVQEQGATLGKSGEVLTVKRPPPRENRKPSRASSSRTSPRSRCWATCRSRAGPAGDRRGRHPLVPFLLRRLVLRHDQRPAPQERRAADGQFRTAADPAA